MWSEIIFGAVVVVAAGVAWKWCKRRCPLDDPEEIEANGVTPAPRIPRKRGSK